MKLPKTAWIIAIYIGLGVLAFSCGQQKGQQGNNTNAKKDGGTVTNPSANNNVPNHHNVPDHTSTTPDQGQPVEPSSQPDTAPPEPPPTGPDNVTQPEPVAEHTQPGPEPDPPEQPVTPEPTPEPAQPPPDRAPPAVQEIRFIAIGDTGKANTGQKQVAQAIGKKCAAEAQPGGRGPCDFGIMLGDNFYDVGVKSATDSQFKTKFEDMYNYLGFKMYTTIGNHDYGALGSGLEFYKAKHYIDYAKTHPNFVFPHNFYGFTQKHVHFISLNTAELFFDYNAKQQTSFVRAEIAKAKQNNSTWTIAFGHHPYISNGVHGNAGQYEGIPIPIPYVSGTNIKKFFEKEICGKVDLYLCGHDHNRQVLHGKCGVEFIVNGAGASGKKWGDAKRNKSYWQSTDIGFMYVHIKGRTMTVQMLDQNAKVEFEKVYTK